MVCKETVLISEQSGSIGGSIFSMKMIIDGLRNQWDMSPLFMHAVDYAHIFPPNQYRPIVLKQSVFERTSFVRAILRLPNFKGKHAFLRFLRTTYFGQQVMKAMEKALCSLPLALIHGNNGPFYNFGEIGYALVHNIPFVGHIRGFVPLSRWVLHRAQKVSMWIAVSYAVKKYYIEQGLPEHTIQVIPNGVDISRFKPSLHEKHENKSNPIRLVSAGRLIEWKGYSWLIDVLFELQRSKPEKKFILTLLGDGPERYTLLEKSKQLGIQEIIQLNGFAAKTEDILNQCDIAIIPSTKPDPFPRFCLEAMASGLPVIGTNAGGVPEAIDDGRNGFLVPPKDTSAMVQKLMILMSNKDLRMQMGNASREKAVNEFSAEAHVKSISDLYNHILRNNPYEKAC